MGIVMILVCGNVSEPVTELVCARLEAEELAYRVLSPNISTDSALQSTVHTQWTNGEFHGGYFSGPDWRLDVDDLTGVYFRPLQAPAADLPGIPAAVAQALQAQRMAALSAIIDTLPCPVVNPVLAGMSNSSKPHQAMLIRACGFPVPATLITNDPVAALAFAAEHNDDIIYKSISGVRSIVRRFGSQQAERLPLLRHGPAQFQQRIQGADVRVHVVADRIFATRIETPSVDYRYAAGDGEPILMQPTELACEVAHRCVALTKRLGLLFAGIDLKETQDGEYFCFEANPSPGFLFFERATGQPISTALAHLLAGRSHLSEAR
ncbi:glutathione synthase [Bradyrhizobium sp. LTSPM299]|jgi:glutathione synthase/RimK-type ligase-like ATP-grasp enzyme|uniref:glutathione synthase n=1 Tax=Bradyrhizobium sp. LTSPM299 TaxID=1619233 RepID=UPI0012E25C89|nr:glutathione synthase [Bradyrhizobium sp. LTSPM299]